MRLSNDDNPGLCRKRDLSSPSNLLLNVPRRYFYCGSLLPEFGIGFGDVSPYVCTDYSIQVAEWPPFGKQLPLCLSYVLFVQCLSVILVISRFGLKGGIWAMIAPAPVHG